MNTSHYTTPFDGKMNTVRIAEFRNQIARLEDIVNRDWHACVTAREQAHCIETAKRAGSELIHMSCKRATVADMDRRERAIDRSTALITRDVTIAEHTTKPARELPHPNIPDCKVFWLFDRLDGKR